MSLRLMYKLLALLFMAIVAFAANRSLSNSETEAQVSADFRALTEFAEATRGNVLTIGGPAVEYPLPPSAQTIRILTNANLRSIDAAREQRQADPARRWQYAIEVDALDSSGRLLHRRLHHFRRDLVEIEMPGGRRGTGAFYLESHAPTPLPTATLNLDFSAADRPSHVRIRLVSADSDIADLLVRTAVPAPVSQRSMDTMWRRLSDEQRERLASGNVFPPDLLTAQERASLLASRWQPIGAAGATEGRDIYVLEGDDLGAPVESPKPAVLTTGPQRLAAIQLPEKGGRMRIVLEAEDEQHPLPGKVTLRWLGHSAFQRQVSTRHWNGGRFELQKNFDGGWLDIGATHNARVRIAMIDDGQSGQEVDMTPPVQYLRAWHARHDSPLDFSVSHSANMLTPVRLVLRRTGSNRQSPANTPVTLTFLDKEKAAVRTVQVTPQFVASQYDAAWPEVPGNTVSDPWEVFFNVPPTVTRLRIASSEDVLVNAYSRPADLPRVIRMPEDVQAPESAQSAIPGWFMLNPDAHESRILDGNSSLLMVQHRPPDDRPDLSTGRYQWEDFDPVGGGAARVFLAPREAGVPDRKEALGGTFRPMTTNGAATFAAEPGRTAVAPRLAWVAKTPGARSYKVMVDGKEWLDGIASGMTGEVALPAFSPGKHHISIAGQPDMRWYANYLQDGTPWVRRRAYRFDRPMQFEIERTSLEEEFVSARLFRPAGRDPRVKVRIKIDAPATSDRIGPFPGWLFTERVVDLRPSGEFALPVAETVSEKTDAGQPFFIPLPKGAPRGRYRITLTPDTPHSWIALSRLTPGAVAKPALILEGMHDAE